MTKKSKRSKQRKVTIKAVRKAKAATTSEQPATLVTRSSLARSHIVQGTRLYVLAGHPTEADLMGPRSLEG